MVKGPQGADGLNGKDGAKGDRGEQGATGKQGPSGVTPDEIVWLTNEINLLKG
jgi:hypothetical protein